MVLVENGLQTTWRPPLFGKPLSNAEHQARWRERQAAKLPPPGPLTREQVLDAIPTWDDVLGEPVEGAGRTRPVGESRRVTGNDAEAEA
jgi:hypothetical protein